MSNRISDKNLEAVVERINIITNSPITPYTLNPNGPDLTLTSVIIT